LPEDASGGLFEQKIDSSRTIELVILLKPIIVDKPNIWKGQIGDFSRKMSIPTVKSHTKVPSYSKPVEALG